MTTALIILAIFFTVLIIYLSTLDGQYNIDRSLIINAPVKETYDAIVDFKSWPEWSPWLLHEPQTSLIYSDNYQQENGYYSWDGKLVGAGKLTHLQLTPFEAIQQEIEFIRPFKSICSVSWTFKEVDGKTEVHWLMQGTMPFFFRFMTKMTISMINKDYELGLHLLNGYLNKDNPHPEITFCGTKDLKEFQYTYIPFKGVLSEMVTAMETGFSELLHKTDKAGITSGLPVTIYRKVDLDKHYFECEIAVPVNKLVDSENLHFNNLSGGKYYKVESLGHYQFLELARYKAETHIKMLKLKLDTSRSSFEVYENSPQPTENSNKIKTSLYFPVK